MKYVISIFPQRAEKKREGAARTLPTHLYWTCARSALCIRVVFVEIRIFAGDEQERLLAQTAKDHQPYTLTMCALSTAPRAGELTRLEWWDVDLAALGARSPRAISFICVMLSRSSQHTSLTQVRQ